MLLDQGEPGESLAKYFPTEAIFEAEITPNRPDCLGHLGIARELGEVLVHGVAIRPGHPVILGVAHSKKALIGIPGYPVSAILTSELFVKPLLFHMQGRPAPSRCSI